VVVVVVGVGFQVVVGVVAGGDHVEVGDGGVYVELGVVGEGEGAGAGASSKDHVP
jgi:hypothetical protein